MAKCLRHRAESPERSGPNVEAERIEVLLEINEQTETLSIKGHSEMLLALIPKKLASNQFRALCHSRLLVEFEGERRYPVLAVRV